MKNCPSCGAELPSQQLQICDLQQECWGCPSSWRGKTIDGLDVYIRYRYGHLRLEVDGHVVHAVDVGDGMDGIMSEDEMARHLGIDVVSHATEAT